MEEKIKKDLRSADEKIKQQIKWWGNVSPTVKGIFVFIGLLIFFLAMLAEIKIIIALVGSWLRVLEMTGIIQFGLVGLLLLVVLYEIKTKGILSTITKILFIMLAIKIAAEFTGVSTAAIDKVLAWIANIPNLIARDLIPWLRFW